MTGFLLLKVPTPAADELAAEIGNRGGCGGIEELPDASAGHFPIDPQFNVVEFGTETARAFDQWLADEKFRSGEFVLLKIYAAVPDAAAWEEWVSDFFRDYPTYECVGRDLVPDQDYTASYRDSVRGHEVGQTLWVGPPWVTPPVDKIPIVIEPGMAFGSGDHATTQLCLEFIEQRATKGFSPERILDIGTGSGVLAITAKKLWPASELWLCDRDLKCQENVARNFELNNLAMPTNTVWGEDLDEQRFRDRATDLVLANIYLESLGSLVSLVGQGLRPGGLWIVSGLLGESQADEFVARAQDQFVVVERVERSGWWALELGLR